ncbi:MAG: DUF3256 family protein [Tannerella sp.]|jgi:hypothetical protein|nr:DUF3256 family protein [Tannerella sp.]
MKYLFLFVFYVSALPVALKAQDMASLFISMPDEYILQLEEAWRKDLVELYRAGKPATLDNTMKGHSTLVQLTPDYLFLQSSERSAIEMKLLPLINLTNIICIVTTVSAPVADSRVAFCTTDWKRLDASDIWTPVTADRFIRDDADRQSEAFLDALSRMDMDLIRYRLHAENATMTAEYMTPEYLSQEDRDKVIPFLKTETLVYQWKTGRYETPR